MEGNYRQTEWRGSVEEGGFATFCCSDSSCLFDSVSVDSSFSHSSFFASSSSSSLISFVQAGLNPKAPSNPFFSLITAPITSVAGFVGSLFASKPQPQVYFCDLSLSCHLFLLVFLFHVLFSFVFALLGNPSSHSFVLVCLFFFFFPSPIASVPGFSSFFSLFSSSSPLFLLDFHPGHSFFPLFHPFPFFWFCSSPSSH